MSALAVAARRRLSVAVVKVVATCERAKYGSPPRQIRKTLQVEPVAANSFTKSHPFEAVLKLGAPDITAERARASAPAKVEKIFRV